MKMLNFSVNGENINIEPDNSTFTLPYPCDNDHTNCFPYFCVLPPGSFLLRVWGGSGGTKNSSLIDIIIVYKWNNIKVLDVILCVFLIIGCRI